MAVAGIRELRKFPVRQVLKPTRMEPPPGNRELVDYIRQQIANHGPVTFKWFMQQALYHPKLGYYGSGRARIGRQGDFYTSVSVGRIFGELLAKQFEQMWERMNRPVSFTILEEGAHDARFAADVLSWTKRFSPDLHACLKYWIVEPNPRWQEEQQATLSVWPRNKVRWSQGLDQFELGALCGVHFSNELLDAFPVHLVTSAGGPWQENFVDVGRQGFRFVYGPPSNSQLRVTLDRMPVPELGAGVKEYRTEVNLTAPRWVEDVSKILGQGYVLAVDYGYPRDVYYLPERTTGTLATYHDHQRGDDPLAMVGECDLTAHVEFTTLAERAEASGMHLTGFTDQHHFLVGLGESELLAIERSTREMTPELLHFIRTFKTLMHPSTMGMAFKFICFEKNVPASEKPLLGFSRCPDSRAALGLETLAGSTQEPYDPYAPI